MRFPTYLGLLMIADAIRDLSHFSANSMANLFLFGVAFIIADAIDFFRGKKGDK